MRVFFFNIEHYVNFEEESQNFLARLPLLNCGLEIVHRDHVHQRDLRSLGRAEAERSALDAVEEFKPDVVIYFQAWKDEDLSANTLGRIRAMGIPIIGFIWDSNLYPRWNEIQLFRNVDCLVIVDSLDAYLRWRMVARMFDEKKHVVFGAGLYHVPLTQKHYDRIYDAVLIGSIEGKRKDLIEHLTSAMAKRGIKFQHFGGLVDPTGTVGVSKDWLNWQEYDAVFRQSKLCISSQTASTRLHIKGKIFEAMARGTPNLVDHNSETARFFPPDVVAFYNNIDDCVDKIAYYCEHPRERERLSHVATVWFEENFDSRKFYSQLLTYIVTGQGVLPVLKHIEPLFERAWKERDMMLPIFSDAVTSLVKHLDKKGALPPARSAVSVRPQWWWQRWNLFRR